MKIKLDMHVFMCHTVFKMRDRKADKNLNNNMEDKDMTRGFTMGRYRGWRYERRPLMDYFPYYEGRGNPLVWFAWEPDGEMIICGLATKRQMMAFIDEDMEGSH